MSLAHTDALGDLAPGDTFCTQQDSARSPRVPCAGRWARKHRFQRLALRRVQLLLNDEVQTAGGPVTVPDPSQFWSAQLALTVLIFRPFAIGVSSYAARSLDGGRCELLEFCACSPSSLHPKDPHSYDRYNVLEKGPYMPNHQPCPDISRIPW